MHIISKEKWRQKKKKKKCREFMTCNLLHVDCRRRRVFRLQYDIDWWQCMNLLFTLDSIIKTTNNDHEIQFFNFRHRKAYRRSQHAVYSAQCTQFVWNRKKIVRRVWFEFYLFDFNCVEHYRYLFCPLMLLLL